MQPPLRLDIDLDALTANWRALRERSGDAACGAAVKANAYGLGAREVVDRLADAGCRDFFVATWIEAAELAPLAEGLRLGVLHGVREADLPFALASGAIPVLNTPAQAALWRAAAPGRPCDVMVDTGMNRLGFAAGDAGAVEGLRIGTLMSHLACADEPAHPMNERQRDAFDACDWPAERRSLANSGGIMLGPYYAFDLTRPGIGIYGGAPGPGRQVARPHAQVLQVRGVPAGASVGYGATCVVTAPLSVAILNVGYADGFFRGFSGGRGAALAGDVRCPVVGRVSMDLTAVDVTAADVAEGDWLEIEFALPEAAAASGMSQYELLTSLGRRYQRRYA